MRYAKLGGLGIFAATALWGGTVMAQQTYQPFMVNEARVASPAVADTQDIDFFAGETYNSNVARSDEALAEARGLKQSDEYTQVGFDFTDVQTLGLNRIFVKADAAYSWYANNHVLNSAFAHFSGGDTLRLGACQATVVGDYYRNRFDEPVVLPEAVENIGTTGSIGLHANCGNKYGIVPSASVMERWNTNSSDVYRNADSRTFTATTGLDYRTPIFGSIGFFGEYDTTRYDNAVLDLDGSLFRDEFDVWSGGARYTKQFDPRLGIQAIVTYTDVNSNLPNGIDFHGLTYLFDANYNPTPVLSAHADFSREVLPSDEPFATYSVNHNYEADIAYAVNQMLRLSVSGWAHNIQYRGTVFFPGINVSGQTLYQVTGTADFKLGRRFWVDLLVAEERGDTDNLALNFWSTRVGVEFRAQFGN